MASSRSDNSSSYNDNNNLLEVEILDSLKEFIGSEPFGQYLSEYIGNTLRNIDRLGIAIALEDEDRIKQVSHKLKGSAGNIGATRLSSICTRLQESAVSDQPAASMRGQFEDLKSTYEETREALNAYIDTLEMSRLKAM
jgi:two-component system sensor histidine kinase TorS